MEYRLVPDPRDLMSARTLLTLPDDNEAIDSADEISTSSLSFDELYNQIPLFGMDQSNPRQSEKVKQFLDKMVSSHSMCFSAHTMLQVLDDNTSSGDLEQELTSLHEVVQEMQEESQIDYRNVLLIPPAPIPKGALSDAVLAKLLADPESYLSQIYFLPLFQE